MEKNGGFRDRAVGSEVCAASALSKAVVHVDVQKKRAVGSVSARRLSVGESGCGRCCWGREKQRLCGFGAAFVLVWTLHCEKQMSMTQCVT